MVYYTRDGHDRPLSFEGQDLVNFGSTNSSGRGDLSIATGVRHKFSQCIADRHRAAIPADAHAGLSDFPAGVGRDLPILSTLLSLAVQPCDPAKRSASAARRNENISIGACTHSSAAVIAKPTRPNVSGPTTLGPSDWIAVMSVNADAADKARPEQAVTNCRDRQPDRRRPP